MMKPIPGFPDYLASDDGEIYSMKPYRNLAKKPTIPRKMSKELRGHGKTFYHCVVVYNNGKRFKKNVAPLILSAFVGPRPPGMFACHGEKRNLVDSLDNLYWDTPTQNQLDKIRDGTDCRGEKNPAHKLTEMAVRVIRRSYSFYGRNGLSLSQLADVFRVNHTVITLIIQRRAWKHIP